VTATLERAKTRNKEAKLICARERLAISVIRKKVACLLLAVPYKLIIFREKKR